MERNFDFYALNRYGIAGKHPHELCNEGTPFDWNESTDETEQRLMAEVRDFAAGMADKWQQAVNIDDSETGEAVESAAFCISATLEQGAFENDAFANLCEQVEDALVSEFPRATEINVIAGSETTAAATAEFESGQTINLDITTKAAMASIEKTISNCPLTDAELDD